MTSQAQKQAAKKKKYYLMTLKSFAFQSLPSTLMHPLSGLCRFGSNFYQAGVTLYNFIWISRDLHHHTLRPVSLRRERINLFSDPWNKYIKELYFIIKEWRSINVPNRTYVKQTNQLIQYQIFRNSCFSSGYFVTAASVPDIS